MNPNVPRWISPAIMRALAKEPDQRFQSAAAFKAALIDDDMTRMAWQPPPLMPSVTAPPVTPPPVTPPPVTGPPVATPPITAPPVTAPTVTASSVPAPTVTGPGLSAVHGASQPVSFEPATIDRLVQALAPYLGPIAKVLVTRAARRARTVNELQEILAAELPSPEDRRRFLARVRSAL